MSNSPWKTSLSRILTRPDRSLPRLALVGVGQSLCGDDGAGPAVIDRLRQLIEPHDCLLLIDCGHAPENCFGPIIRFSPDEILFIDAIRLDEAAGAIRWLCAHQADSAGGSTHTLSLGLLAVYLAGITGANAHVLGICPANMAFGEGLSPPVREAVEDVAGSIAGYWRNAATACSAMVPGGESVVNT